jgi:hypothetical protein
MFRFCGRDLPAIHTSNSNIVTLHYVTSTNNTGKYAEDSLKSSFMGSAIAFSPKYFDYLKCSKQS